MLAYPCNKVGHRAILDNRYPVRHQALSHVGALPGVIADLAHIKAPAEIADIVLNDREVRLVAGRDVQVAVSRPTSTTWAVILISLMISVACVCAT